MPKLWNDTIEDHRREVREAILDATADLVTAHGLLAVTMSQIAETTGIGRATLYKYFPDVEAILQAWHQRRIARHLEHLAEVRDSTGDPYERLEAVLTAYALTSLERGRHDSDVAALLHSGEHVASAERELHVVIRDLLVDAAKSGRVRGDIPATELAYYSLNALAAARELRSKAAIGRLVEMTLDGLSATH